MTMAFLPATYFAALFAVPSLKWDQPGDVIQSNFWVYWAFTVPSTLVVFFLWYLVTNWSPRWLFGG
jgi:predicted neutral ceramidase superfamily lipid hydrolase